MNTGLKEVRGPPVRLYFPSHIPFGHTAAGGQGDSEGGHGDHSAMYSPVPRRRPSTVNTLRDIPAGFDARSGGIDMARLDSGGMFPIYAPWAHAVITNATAGLRKVGPAAAGITTF